MSYTKTVLLTGGTSGLGYYAALNIAQKQLKYLVIITGRSDPNSSAQKINTRLSQKNVAFSPSIPPLLPESVLSQNHVLQRTIHLPSPPS
jgi:NAD(P)-dependent dehydrogenase (short-subunit alcohol dehydrogenase family)